MQVDVVTAGEPPVEWARGRSVLVVGAAALAISAVAFFRVPLLPSIGRDLVLRPGVLSLVTVVFGIGRLLADLPAGRVAERFPALRALAGAALLLAAGSALLAQAGSLAPLLGAAAVIGVGSAFANTTGMTFFSRAPAARRGTSMAIFSAALLGGQSLGPAVSGPLTAVAGWRGTELLAAAAAVAVAAACLAVGRTPRAGRETSDAAPQVDLAPLTRPVRAVLYGVPFAVFFGLGAMPQTLVPLVGAGAHGLSAGRVGVALGAGGVFRFLGAAVGGVVADRVGRKPSLLPGLVLSAVGIGLVGVGGPTWVWFLAIVLMSFGSYGITVGATMLADLVGVAGVGRRLGSFRFVGDFGLILGPLVAGILYDRLGIVAAVACVAGLIGAVAAGAALVLPETVDRRGSKRLL